MATKTTHTDMRCHAFSSDDALGLDDAVAMRVRLQRGEVSPLELTEAAIARAEQVNGQLNAIVLPTYETARLGAQRQHGGAFAGIPTFIKDNTDLQGLPTRHGSLAVGSIPAKHTSAFAEHYLSTGLNVLGKSSLPEFGFNASTEFMSRPATVNPWHTAYSAGASSGGSAALVAAGVVPIAHANDGGGSIRIPAAACGLIGLKPTRGRFIDGESAAALPVNIIGEGVVTRSVRDTAEFFYAMEQHYRGKKMRPVGQVSGPDDKRQRIGLVLDSITGQATDAATRETVEATARLLESLGHRVDVIELPIRDSFADDFSQYWGLLSFLLSTFGTKLMGPDFDKSLTDNLSKGLAQFYREHIWRTPMMLWGMKRVAADYAKIFRGCDVVLSPVLAHTTPKLGHLSPTQSFESLFERLRDYVSFTPLNNAAGTPALSMPMGRTPEGLPIAVQLSGARGEERRLLALAFELEAAQPFHHLGLYTG
ncbi:amidase [Paraperlucidibaca baekdonensis]|uniref:Amidase n=1 Tax=Paraperlucidibaca baekdonensis TaxID=748120 RepID=A0A3E0H844_9GAMM|nr:amidase [Paraperlucidibaca baekdonensis]REH39006.1 amidase [Paraperlucidibaca baekdonensis]